jgi:hypothetical protein
VLSQSKPFQSEGNSIFSKTAIDSKSKTPFLGMKLIGKAYGIVNNEQLILA